MSTILGTIMGGLVLVLILRPVTGLILRKTINVDSQGMATFITGLILSLVARFTMPNDILYGMGYLIGALTIILVSKFKTKKVKANEIQ